MTASGLVRSRSDLADGFPSQEYLLGIYEGRQINAISTNIFSSNEEDIQVSSINDDTVISSSDKKAITTKDITKIELEKEYGIQENCN